MKRTDFKRLKEGSRGFSGADGSGGVLARQDTCGERATDTTSTYLGPPKNLVEKGLKNVQSRRLAGEKKGEEVRIQIKGTRVEG